MAIVLGAWNQNIGAILEALAEIKGYRNKEIYR